jgi:hypothetical protein
MIQVDFVLFALASYGLCFGVMNDKIPFLRLLRLLPVWVDEEGKNFFARMFECPYCTGFHTGWALWLTLSLPLSGKVAWGEVLIGAACWGFASSAACYILDTLVVLVEKKTPR